MPDLPQRAKHESGLTTAVAAVFAEHKPDDPLAPINWPSLRLGLTRAIAPKLAVTFSTSGDQLNQQHGLGLSDESIADRAVKWSNAYTPTLAGSIVANSYKAVEAARVRQQEQERENKRNVAGAALLLMGGQYGRPGTAGAGTGNVGGLVAAGGMQDTLDRVFGTDRAETIGVTETTRAATHGELGIIAAYALIMGSSIAPDGTDLDQMIWNTQEDEAVCDRCDPLDGTGPEVWRDDAPDGPPQHVRCRCFLTHGPGGDEYESAASRVREGGVGSGIRGHHTDRPHPRVPSDSFQP